MADQVQTKGPFSLVPYIIVKGGDAAIKFYEKVFGAKEAFRLAEPNGRIGHAELKIGDGAIMMADESPSFGALSPPTVGGTPVSLHLYVEDVDSVVAQAVAAGAKLTRPVADQFYGDRVGGITDPFGHRWFIATHKEDLTSAEIHRRAAAQGH